MKYFLPAIVLTLLIAYFSTRGGVSLPVDLMSIDKLEHFFAYFGLAVTFLWGFWKIARLTNRTAWIVFFCCSLYGFGLEIIQYAYFPDRFFELLDIVANICGAFAGLYLFRFFVNKTS
ncbi:MAG: hypothetical protein D6816_04020 [Bacteroidetes bacterium]|nr:MAG: hypothetical protein D6816_04020 [Bacteroidota bacterium]